MIRVCLNCANNRKSSPQFLFFFYHTCIKHYRFHFRFVLFEVIFIKKIVCCVGNCSLLNMSLKEGDGYLVELA